MDGRLSKALEDLTLPPLPPITDPELRDIAFTHKSAAIITQKDKKGIERLTKVDYEKLAHVGDALLQAAVTCMLQRLFPEMPKGHATNLRSLLVRRASLAKLSFEYKIPSQVRTSLATQSAVIMSDNNAAEMFEAYIAAVYYSHLQASSGGLSGFEVLDDWLDPLFSPIAELLYEPEDAEAEQLDIAAVGAKPELHELEQLRQISDLKFDHDEVVPLGAKGKVGQQWVTTCKARYRGVDFSRSTTRETKKKGSDGAAYLLLQDMWDAGLIRRGRWDPGM